MLIKFKKVIEWRFWDQHNLFIEYIIIMNIIIIAKSKVQHTWANNVEFNNSDA